MSDKKKQFSYDTDREIYSAAKVRALEALLIEKGIISNKTVDKVLDFFETEMGPFNGAKIVARAWVDAAFKKRLLEDATAAIAEMKLPAGMAGAEGELCDGFYFDTTVPGNGNSGHVAWLGNRSGH